MELKKNLSICIIITLLHACNHKNTDYLFFQDEVYPYQIFPIDKDTTLYLYIYDKWGETNNIVLKTNDTIYVTGFDIDPLPVIEKVSGDTIYLKYDWYTKMPELDSSRIYFHKPYIEENQYIGKYTIINKETYRLYGIGGLIVDSVNDLYVKNDTLNLLLYSGDTISKALKDYVFEQFYHGDKFVFSYSVFRNMLNRDLSKKKEIEKFSHAYLVKDKVLLKKYLSNYKLK